MASRAAVPGVALPFGCELTSCWQCLAVCKALALAWGGKAGPNKTAYGTACAQDS
jgi:hypothetical protein